MVMKCQICNEDHDVEVVSRMEKVKCPKREYNVNVTSYECKGKEWMVANVIPDEGETLQDCLKAYLRDFAELVQLTTEDKKE